MLLIFCVIFIPNHYIDVVVDWLKRHEGILKEKSDSYRARTLVSSLAVLISSINIDRSKVPKLCEYKFYTNLIYQLLDFSRTHGGPIKDSLKQIRELVIKHYKIGIKVSKVRSSSRFQVVLSSAIIWFFAIFAEKSIGIELKLQTYIMIGFIQVMAFVFEYKLVISIENKNLTFHESLIESSFVFSILFESGQSFNSALSKSNLLKVFEAAPSKFQYYEQNFENIIGNWRKFGTAANDEIQYFVDEVKFGHESQMEEFEKQCRVVQFIVMSLFIFPCFFLIIFELMQQDMMLVQY